MVALRKESNSTFTLKPLHLYVSLSCILVQLHFSVKDCFDNDGPDGYEEDQQNIWGGVWGLVVGLVGGLDDVQQLQYALPPPSKYFYTPFISPA